MTGDRPEESIDLVPTNDVPAPRLTGGVVHRPDADQLIDAMLAELEIHARNCVRAFGDFQFAISGNEQTEPYLRRLMYDPAHREFPWLRTRVWMADEEAGGGRWARIEGLVLEQSGIPAEQVHRLKVTTPREEGIDQYEAELRQTLGWREKGHDRLDFVLLSLSPAGGVAGYERFRLEEPPVQDERLLAVIDPQEGGTAVSMTMSFINAARMVGVIAAGAECRDAVSRLAEACRIRRRDKTMPAMWLAPMAGELRFYLDNAACPGATA